MQNSHWQVQPDAPDGTPLYHDRQRTWWNGAEGEDYAYTEDGHHYARTRSTWAVGKWEPIRIR